MQQQKIIVIGDIHGEQTWKNIINKHPKEKYIFLGDYCDPYNAEAPDCEVMENLQQIVQFKKDLPDSVTLLLGNHDIQYIYKEASRCTRYMRRAAFKIKALFNENITLFNRVYSHNGILFTHAGVTDEWFKTTFPEKESKDAAELICRTRKKRALFACGIARWGRELYGGIYWADIREFDNPLKSWIQVVGHNKVQEITVKNGVESGIVVLCDSVWNGNYLIIEEKLEHYEFFAANITDDRTEKILTISKT